MHKSATSNHYLMEQVDGDKDKQDLEGKMVFFKSSSITGLEVRGKIEWVMSINDSVQIELKDVMFIDREDRMIDKVIQKVPEYMFIENEHKIFGKGTEEKSDIYYECGRVFKIRLFSGDFEKEHDLIEFTCDLLADVLDERLPCKGGYDFSLNSDKELDTPQSFA